MYIFNSFYLVHIIQVFSFVRVLTLPLSDAVSPPPPPHPGILLEPYCGTITEPGLPVDLPGINTLYFVKMCL